MKKLNVFVLILSVLVAVAIIVVVVTFALDTTGKVNQGNFRINDAVLTSMLSVTETNSKGDEPTEIADMLFSVSQTNRLSLLISKTQEISSMYVDNIKYTLPSKVGTLYIAPVGIGKGTEISQATKVEIQPEQKDDQYYLEINFNNESVLNDAKVPSDTKLLKYDCTMLSLLNLKTEDLTFNVSFNLNIVDITGKTVTCKIELKLPNEKLEEEGTSIVRQDVSNYVFSIKK